MTSGEFTETTSENGHPSLLQQIRDRLALDAPFTDDSDPAVIEEVRGLVDSYSQQAEADPLNEPEAVIARITSQYYSAHEMSARVPSTLNGIVSRYGVSLQRFRKVGLSPYDEVALLKAAVYAGFSRRTVNGHQLARKAIRMLHHEATNVTLPRGDGNTLSEAANMTRIARAIFASKAINELYEIEDSEPITNVDEALRNWRAMVEAAPAREAEEPLIEAEEYMEEESRVSLRKLFDVEVEDRLKGLRVIGNSLQEALGDNVQVRYFETVVFNDREAVDGLLTEPGNGGGTAEEDKEAQEEQESSAFFGSDYVIAEVTETLADGSKLVHIIAESPNYANACYVMRGDTLNAINQATGENLDWRTIFSFPKVTTRQLSGAMNFRHTNGRTIPEKVLDYLRQDIQDTLKVAARRWFTGAKPIYSENLEVTRFNRLPAAYKQRIESRLPEIREAMLAWGGEAAEHEAREVGASAISGSGVSQPEAAEQSIREQQLIVEKEQLQLEKMELESKNEELERRVQELQERLASIASLSAQERE